MLWPARAVGEWWVEAAVHNCVDMCLVLACSESHRALAVNRLLIGPAGCGYRVLDARLKIQPGLAGVVIMYSRVVW